MRINRLAVFALTALTLSTQLFFMGAQPAKAADDVSVTCSVGSSSSCPAQSPQEIINLYGTSTNGTYWLNVNGTATQTYLILDSNYPNGGAWFLGMKGTKTSTAFTYSANYWTDPATTLAPSSLSDNVTTDAKFNAFNYLPITRITAVFKDRDSQAFNASGSGDYGDNSFAGHTWAEAISSQTMLSRFNTNSNISAGSGVWGNYSKYRETNLTSGKLVFPYQTGYSQYGYANTNGPSYRWGVTFNNESSQGSNDSVSGIGLASYSAAGVLSYSDSLSYTVDGTTNGALNGGTQTLQSGFQIWGKMAAGSLAAPTLITQSQQSTSTTRIAWAAVASANEYLVQYKTSAQSWSQGSTVRVTSPSASPSALITGLTDSSYDLRIWARGSNNTYGSASGSLTATLDQTAPTITGPSSATGATSSSSIPENSTAIHIFTANESVTWSKSGTDGSFFAINSSSGVLTISARDFESPVDNGSNNTYEVIVTATDAVGNAKTQTVTVTITNVNEAPTITIASSAATHAITQAENSTSVITYTATDVDAGSTLTFSLTGTDAADFSINSSTGVLEFATAPDFEAPADSDVNNVYTVVITVSDGALSDTQELTVTITNANESAVLSAPTYSGTINKGVRTSISVTLNTAGKVRFFVGGKRISNCLARTTTGSYPSYSATCSWKPPVTGRQNLTARVTPTDNTFSTSTSTATSVWVVKRTSTR